MSQQAFFHLAFPVHDLHRAREFYAGALGCVMGRSTERSQCFEWQGHQLVALLSTQPLHTELVDLDGLLVPVFHFGLLVEWAAFGSLRERLRLHGVPVLTETEISATLPKLAEPTAALVELRRFFIRDPCGNVLEFKTCRDSCTGGETRVSPPC